MKGCTHNVFSIILLYSLYIFTVAQSKAQTDYFVKTEENETIFTTKSIFQ